MNISLYGLFYKLTKRINERCDCMKTHPGNSNQQLLTAKVDRVRDHNRQDRLENETSESQCNVNEEGPTNSPQSM